MQVSDAALRRVLDPPTTEWRSRRGLRDAAVLAPVVRQDGADCMLYTVRCEHLKSHAGEMSFPGGAREGDENALTCALREAWEEVGVGPPAVDVLGRLPARPSIAGYEVQVFVARLTPIDDLGALPIDRDEVARALTIPIGALFHEGGWDWRSIDGRRPRRRLPFFDYGDETLWGLTAVLTRDLLARLRAADGDGR